MGVETPIPPEMMKPAAPDGAPPRRIKTVGKKIFPIFMVWVRTRAVHACFYRAKNFTHGFPSTAMLHKGEP